MFEFTIKECEFLNEFKNLFSSYVNKAYQFSMKYLVNPVLSDYRENERLVLIVINKSIFQNLYSFIKLNDSNMQFSAFSCLENAVDSMRLFHVLINNPNYMHEYITKPDFSMEFCEAEIADEQIDFDANKEQFSLKEFSNALHMINSFKLKNTVISSQIIDNNVFLGLSCGKTVSDDLQNEVRKNLIGAYLSLQIHTKMFFNGGIDSDLEDVEDELYAKFLEYVKLFS